MGERAVRAPDASVSGVGHVAARARNPSLLFDQWDAEPLPVLVLRRPMYARRVSWNVLGGGTRRRGGFGPGERRARAPGTCASLTTHPPPSTSPPERARAQWGSCVIGLRYSRAPCSHLSCGPRWGPRGGRSGGRSLPPDARPSEGPAAARTSPPVATTSGRVIPWGCSIWHAPHHEKTLSAASHLRSRLFGGRGPNLR